MGKSRYSGRYDKRSLELRFREIERRVGGQATPSTKTVVVQRSTGAGVGTSGSTVEEHVRKSDPHPQYYLESEAEGDLAAIEGDIAALEARATDLEADVGTLLSALPRTLVENGDPFIIPEDRQVSVYGTLTVEGELEVNGELVIHG